jgi:hypothetical protein
LRQHYGQDTLAEYGTEAIPDTVRVVNPSWRQLDSQIRRLNGERQRHRASEASRPGGEYLIPLLNSYRAAWAILRQWCHNDALTAAREKEISTLVQLVWDAIYALQKAGADEEAARLRHVLEHG